MTRLGITPVLLVNALRAEYTGVSRYVPRRKLSIRLKPALEEMLAPEIIERAARLGEMVRSEGNGADEAARQIARLFAKPSKK